MDEHKPRFEKSSLKIGSISVSSVVDLNMSCVIVEFDFSNEEAPVLLIAVCVRSSVVRVVFDLRESLNEDTPSSPISFQLRMRFVRLEFDLR